MAQQGNQSSFGSFVLGFFIGAGLGATVALLKAPQSGEKTREQLQRAAEEFRTEADNVVSTTRTYLQEARDELTRHAGTLRSEAEAAIKETQRVLAEGARGVQQQAQESTEHLRETVTSMQGRNNG